MDIWPSVSDNYDEVLTGYLIDKYQQEPVDISNMTIKEATNKIKSIFSKIEIDAGEHLDPLEIEAVYKGRKVYFNTIIIKNNNTMYEILEKLGLPN